MNRFYKSNNNQPKLDIYDAETIEDIPEQFDPNRYKNPSYRVPEYSYRNNDKFATQSYENSYPPPSNLLPANLENNIRTPTNQSNTNHGYQTLPHKGQQQYPTNYSHRHSNFQYPNGNNTNSNNNSNYAMMQHGHQGEIFCNH